MSNRIYYLDAMRGILMLLGVVLHSALVYSPSQSWLVFSDESTVFASVLAGLIHFFRMQAFFIVSGYFALFTLRKYNIKKFIKMRVSRILIPLISTALTLNLLQTYLLVEHGYLDTTVGEFIFNKTWQSHLWFLVNLIFYFLFAALLVKLFRKKVYRLLEKIDVILLKVPYIFIFFSLPLLNIFFVKFSEVFAFDIPAIIHTESFFLYLAFFLFGMLLQSHKVMLEKFTSISPIVSVVVILISLYISKYYKGDIYELLKLYIEFLGMWFCSSLCFYIFRKFFNHNSKLFRTLSESSYSIYLFHHVFVIIFAIYFIDMGIGGLFGMLLLISVVSVVSISIHLFFISKINILSFLFNGKFIR
ncbi:MAG: acyltransferase family protein [Campylobacterales bacterium]|nr:acyltransferase family protein [Campylobacterales bacterium]